MTRLATASASCIDSGLLDPAEACPGEVTGTRPDYLVNVRESFIIRQLPIGQKDDYGSENFWISDGLPSSSRRRRRGDGRGEGGEWREK